MSKPLLYFLSLAAPIALIVAAIPSRPDRAAVRFDDGGLKSIQYAGMELLASGQLQVNAVKFATADGGTIEGELQGQTIVDVASQRIARTFRLGDGDDELSRARRSRRRDDRGRQPQQLAARRHCARAALAATA